VHDGGAASRRGVRVVCGLALRSFALGLFGQADAVEFHGKGRSMRPFPVEHKRGRSKSHDADRIQLCAQAMCLEEMLGVEVPTGALFYATPRRREEVELTEALRAATVETAARLHDLIDVGRTPPARYDRKKCGLCSLRDRCLPAKDGPGDRVARYMERMLADEEGT
jgi:CRISPR-associated exonuclease Cas4